MESFTQDQLLHQYLGQNEILRMLKVFTDFCEHNNIQYFASGGTLLGAVRHKGWIPHDADIDICMMEEDYDKFCNIFPIYHEACFFQNTKTDPKWSRLLQIYERFSDHSNKFLSKKESPFRFSRLTSTNLEYKNPLAGLQEERLNLYYGVRIDLFKWRLSEHRKPNPDWVCNEWEGWIKNNFQLNYEDVFPLNILQFENLKLPIPNNYEKWLNASYGESWRIPISGYPHEYKQNGKIGEEIENATQLHNCYCELSEFALETLFKYKYTVFKIPNSPVFTLLGKTPKNELFIDSSHKNIKELNYYICTTIAT